MKDNFSSGSDQYALFRPTYPAALFDHLLSLTPRREQAWDCGTGNGQVAVVLAESFDRVFATDISAAQLASAPPHERIEYSVQPAEKTTFPDDSFDLITVAQAIHWLDFEAFYCEVDRVVRPGGVLAVIGYDRPRLSPAVDAVLDAFYRDVAGPYWDRERRYIDEQYRTIPFPYTDLATPSFAIEAEWSFRQLIGYLGTWSAVKHYQKANGEDPVAGVAAGLKKNWGDDAVKKARFPIFLRVATFALLFCLFVQTAFCQAIDSSSIFIVDSLLVKDAPAPDDTLMMSDIASMAVIKDKDSLQRIGYAGYEKVSYIITKAWRARPDSLRRIPSTKQMAPINGFWLLRGTPYTGLVINYYLNGKKLEEARMVRGVPEGMMRRWYQNGQVQLEREYKAGKMDGMDREYYEDGTLWKEGRFAADSAEGAWKAWFPNGRVQLINNYRHGQGVDSAVKYYSTGAIRLRILFNNGKPVMSPQQEKISQLLEKVRESESKGELDAAIRHATKMIQLDSSDADAWYVRGTLKLNKHRFDEAIADLDKALTIEPYFDLALANRAFARIQKYGKEDGRSLPVPEKKQIGADLRKAAFLGYKDQSVFDALKQFGQ
jgi:ubiquinone/menaquinone biosynthesis C-methylase UbiE